MQKSNLPPKAPFKLQKRRRARKRKRSKGSSHSQAEKFSQFYAPSPALISQSNRPSVEIWRKTYENLAQWQLKYQTQYWRNMTNQLRFENEQLRTQLESVSKKFQSIHTEVPSTKDTESSSTEDEDEDNDPVDEEYLEFIIKTRQHQTEVQNMKDEQQNKAETDPT